MNRRTLVNSLAIFLPTVLGVAACASGTKQSQSLTQVDDLLARVERVQVEALVSKDSAHAAAEKLNTLVAPEFADQATVNYPALVESIEKSEQQAKKLKDTVQPMAGQAEKVFEQWTEDLQSFGNSKMRQRSQARLEDTRARYQAIMTTAKSAQIAYDAFNADLRDHALFLGHDFNSTAVDDIAAEVRALVESTHELDRRLDACAAAARAYVESAALPGQLDAHDAEVAPEKPAETPAASTNTTTRKKRAPANSTTSTSNSYLKPKSSTGPAPEAPSKPVTDTTNGADTPPSPTPPGYDGPPQGDSSSASES